MAKKAGLKWWQWAIIGVTGIVTVSTIAGVSYASKDELKLNGGAYSVADVDAQGRVYEAKTALVSKLIETKKATIEFDNKADVTVIVHFYDKDEVYVSSTDAVSEDSEVSAPEGVEFMRFEIVHETDTEVSYLEKFEYAGQVSIVYERP